MRRIRGHGGLMAFALALFALAACGDDAPGGRSVDAGNDAAADAAPASNQVSPARDAGSCTPGEQGCACGKSARCSAGLRCSGGRCETCPAGEQGCVCKDRDSCSAELQCMSGVCAVASCEPGSQSCPCRDGECNGGLACGSDSQCHACDADAVGCACKDGRCGNGLVCGSDQQCRKPASCAQLQSDKRCAPHQLCRQETGADASCTAEVCEDGYRWDAGKKACVECPGCKTGHDCSSGTGGIGNACAGAYRTCSVQDKVARCGGCVEDAEEVNGSCLPALRCGDKVCGASEYCDRLAQQCTALPCPSGQARRDAPGASCGACTTSCAGPGFTGRFWPFRTKSDKCVCETQPGFFIEAGAFMAQRCDADGDGWVRFEADDAAIRDDDALLQNARCRIERVERVKLQDEYGVTRTLRSCRDEGFVVDQPGATCSESFPLRLLESPRNDAAEAVDSPETPAYGGDAGRRLYGSELNGLTKACVSDLGDFDDDGVEDLVQVQPTKLPASATDRQRLQAFSYFVELVRARHQPAQSGEVYGSLLLEERSRCDASSFPLHYSKDDTYAANGGSQASPGFWRTCTRFRDASYDAARAVPGYDFAQWSCADTTGSCQGSLSPLGPASATESYATNDPKQQLLRGAGLCELQGQPPRDATFRGFGHASQFRCLRVVPNPTAPNEAAASAFGAGGAWVFDRCKARACKPDAPDCQESRPIPDSKTFDPAFDCQPVQPNNGEVGFGLRSYQAYGTSALYTQRNAPRNYAAGCVNEDTEWGGKLCPSPEFTVGFETDSFGRYSCYGDKSRWLWAAPGQSQRASLSWSSPKSGAANMSVWSIP